LFARIPVSTCRISFCFGVFVLQKRGRPPKPREEDHADFEEEADAEALAPPQSKRKRAASATAAAALEDQPLIGQLPSLFLSLSLSLSLCDFAELVTLLLSVKE
jgi:hypothetical protein